MSEQIPLAGMLGISAPMPAPGSAPSGAVAEGVAGFPAFDLVMQSHVSQRSVDGQPLPPGGQFLPQTDQERLALQSLESQHLSEDASLTLSVSSERPSDISDPVQTAALLSPDAMVVMQPLSEGEQLRDGVVLSEQWPGMTPTAALDMRPTDADQLVRDVLASPPASSLQEITPQVEQTSVSQSEKAMLPVAEVISDSLGVVETKDIDVMAGRLAGENLAVGPLVATQADASVDISPVLPPGNTTSLSDAFVDINRSESGLTPQMTPTAAWQSGQALPGQNQQEQLVQPDIPVAGIAEVEPEVSLTAVADGTLVTDQAVASRPDPLAAAIAGAVAGQPDSPSARLAGGQESAKVSTPGLSSISLTTPSAAGKQPAQLGTAAGIAADSRVVPTQTAVAGVNEGAAVTADDRVLEPELNLAKKSEISNKAATDLSALQGKTVEPATTKVESTLFSQPSVATPQSASTEQPAAKMAPGFVPQFTMAGKGQMGSPQWGQAMNERIMVMAAQNNQVAEIQLDPPELGSLKIRLQVGQDQVSVNFTSPHASVRDAVEQSLPRLREMMEEQGLQLGDSSVNDQGSESDQDSREGGQRSQFAGDTDTGTEGAVSQQNNGEGVSLVDYYA